MFCGDCGRSVSAAPPPPIVRPVLPEPPVSREPEPEPELEPEPEPEPEPKPEPKPEPEPELGDTCPRCGTPAEPDDHYCAECGTTLQAPTLIVEALSPPAVAPQEPEVARDDADIEATRRVPPSSSGHRFVLQFSTGESVTVTGTGLAGRHPRAEPGEFVDNIITMMDPGRSVSKTHFEFGHENGVFWFSDRHSGNGSVIREPGAVPRLCEPGRRYRIVRGTRIDIGEQFVVVS